MQQLNNIHHPLFSVVYFSFPYFFIDCCIDSAKTSAGIPLLISDACITSSGIGSSSLFVLIVYMVELDATISFLAGNVDLDDFIQVRYIKHIRVEGINIRTTTCIRVIIFGRDIC